MKHWPQQLNFATWWRLQAVKFHVKFSMTVRHKLYRHKSELCISSTCISQSEDQNNSALPEDPTFSQKVNHFDVSSYKRICNEFGEDSSSNFRFTRGDNRGLGSAYI